MQQDGLEILLRTMLTFTGKGLLFAAGLAAPVFCGLCRTNRNMNPIEDIPR